MHTKPAAVAQRRNTRVTRWTSQKCGRVIYLLAYLMFTLGTIYYAVPVRKWHAHRGRRRNEKVFTAGLQTWISESTSSANEWSTHGINFLNMSWTRRPSTHLKTGWTTSGKIWTLQAALLNKSIIVQVQESKCSKVKRSTTLLFRLRVTVRN